MAATTPTGSRKTSELPTFSSNAKPGSIFAYMAKVKVGEPAWMRPESLSGMPTSPQMVLAISSPRAFRPSWIFCSSVARSAGVLADQASNAARAAATAALASSAFPAGMRPMISSVDALMTLMVLSPAGLTHLPLM